MDAFTDGKAHSFFLPENFISLLKSSGLSGRGGANFPTGEKFRLVKKAKGERKYVICNGSEGEPGVKKDRYVLENHTEELVNGIRLAMAYLDSSDGIIYLNSEYYRDFSGKLRRAIGNSKIKIFMKPEAAGYVGGVDSALLNVIEGERAEPRMRPPFPTDKGLFGYPTLISNVETFYEVALVAKREYRGRRLYTVGGEYGGKEVYELPEDIAIEDVLVQTKNYPMADFFVQVGGDASGLVLNSSQLDRRASGAASITVHKISSHNPMRLFRKWAGFFEMESCGRCTPCREGTFRMKEILSSEDPDWNAFIKLLGNMKETSFCGLGSSVPVPFLSYLKNVVQVLPPEKLSSIKNHEELVRLSKRLK